MNISSNPSVTVIISVYNTAKYLSKCLESIKLQNFENLCLIIINDASNDNSKQIIEDYIKANKNLKITFINNNKNLGAGISRNIALYQTITDYVMFVDGDDFLTKKNAIKDIVNNIEKQKSDLSVFNYIKTYSKYHFSKNKQYNLLKKDFINIDDLKLSILNQSGIGACWNKIYKTSFLKDNKIFFSNYLYEDMIFFYKCIFFSQKININNNFYYNYIKRSNSLMSTKKINYQDIFKSYQEIIDFFNILPNNDFNNNFKSIAFSKINSNLFKLLKKCLLLQKISYYNMLKQFIIDNKNFYKISQNNPKFNKKINSVLTKKFLLNFIKYAIL